MGFAVVVGAVSLLLEFLVVLGGIVMRFFIRVDRRWFSKEETGLHIVSKSVA